MSKRSTKKVSRSRKKVPIISIASCKPKSLRLAKKRANKRVRLKDDIAQGSEFKKIDDNWSWPNDGKKYFDNEKGYRK